MVLHPRRAELADCPSIVHLIDSAPSGLFGKYNAASIVEKAALAVCVVDDAEHLEAFGALYSSPDIAGVTANMYCAECSLHCFVFGVIRMYLISDRSSSGSQLAATLRTHLSQ